MPVVTYNILYTKYITEEQYIEYSHFIKGVFKDSRGWRQEPYGYDFKEVDSEKAIKVRFVDNIFLVNKFGNLIDKL